MNNVCHDQGHDRMIHNSIGNSSASPVHDDGCPHASCRCNAKAAMLMRSCTSSPAAWCGTIVGHSYDLSAMQAQVAAWCGTIVGHSYDISAIQAQVAAWCGTIVGHSYDLSAMQAQVAAWCGTIVGHSYDLSAMQAQVMQAMGMPELYSTEGKAVLILTNLEFDHSTLQGWITHI
eukprot:1156448-Pelagomonas_calceolata.AAC.4